MPSILSSIVELASRAETLRNDAAPEFEALGEFAKVSAIAKTVTVISDTPKIVSHIRKTVEDLTE